jgi:hypothetical protein
MPPPGAYKASARFGVVSLQLHEVLIEGGAMTNHVRMGRRALRLGQHVGDP